MAENRNSRDCSIDIFCGVMGACPLRLTEQLFWDVIEHLGYLSQKNLAIPF
jgi:hypothetical protein